MLTVTRRALLPLLSASAAFTLAPALADQPSGPAKPSPAGPAPGTTTAKPPGEPAKRGELLRQLTPDDEKIHDKCVRTTMRGPAGKVFRWKNPKTGNRGEITPTGKAERVAGRACRDFRETVTLRDGRSETITGRRCQNPDGSWDFVG
jgi:hypothetical protein